MKTRYAWITAALVLALGGTAFAQEAVPGGTEPDHGPTGIPGESPQDTEGVEDQQENGYEDAERQQQELQRQREEQLRQQQEQQQLQQEQQQQEQQQQEQQQQEQQQQQPQQPGAQMPEPGQQSPQAQNQQQRSQQEGVNLSALDSDQVMELQRSLAQTGYYTAEIDGKVGPETKSALRRFYSDQAQLAQQGKILPESAAALGIDEAEIERVRGEDQREKQEKQERQQQAPEEQPGPAQTPEPQHDEDHMQDDMMP
jgi:hypothetical protein